MDSVEPIGTVVSVRGAVVDVSFDGDVLPPINTALIVEWDRPELLVLEVHSHVDSATVRGIALQATAGLARSTKVRATGGGVRVASIRERQFAQVRQIHRLERGKLPYWRARTVPPMPPMPPPGIPGAPLSFLSLARAPQVGSSTG